MRVRELFPKRDRDWHRWFAWRPVFSYRDRCWVWLEWIERSYSYSHGYKCYCYQIPRGASVWRK